jgi:hypothetical protein
VTIPMTWTLWRDAHRVTCTLLEAATDYIVRVTHDGTLLMDVHCQDSHEAAVASLDAFSVFSSNGWSQPQGIRTN